MKSQYWAWKYTWGGGGGVGGRDQSHSCSKFLPPSYTASVYSCNPLEIHCRGKPPQHSAPWAPSQPARCCCGASTLRLQSSSHRIPLLSAFPSPCSSPNPSPFYQLPHSPSFLLHYRTLSIKREACYTDGFVMCLNHAASLKPKHHFFYPFPPTPIWYFPQICSSLLKLKTFCPALTNDNGSFQWRL